MVLDKLYVLEQLIFCSIVKLCLNFIRLEEFAIVSSDSFRVRSLGRLEVEVIMPQHPVKLWIQYLF
jgi:hypothetical protein